MLNAAIVWMKLISYALANQDYRLSAKKKDGETHHQATLAIIENLDQDDMGIEYPRYVSILVLLATSRLCKRLHS